MMHACISTHQKSQYKQKQVEYDGGMYMMYVIMAHGMWWGWERKKTTHASSDSGPFFLLFDALL